MQHSIIMMIIVQYWGDMTPERRDGLSQIPPEVGTNLLFALGVMVSVLLSVSLVCGIIDHIVDAVRERWNRRKPPR